MKKTAIRLMAMLLCICMGSVTAYGAEYLIPVGQVIGLELSDNTVTVAAFDDTVGEKTRQAGSALAISCCRSTRGKSPSQRMCGSH